MNNILVKEELVIECSGSGEDTHKAVENALGDMRSKLVTKIKHPIITLTTDRIELIERNDDVRHEAFMFFFSKRERRTINLKLKCNITVNYLNLERG